MADDGDWRDVFLHRGEVPREMLPVRCSGYQQQAVLEVHGARVPVLLETDELPNGTLCGVRIRAGKTGTSLEVLTAKLAIATTKALRGNGSLEALVARYVDIQSEPAIRVEGNEALTRVASLLDYLFRELAISYLQRFDLADPAYWLVVSARQAVRPASTGPLAEVLPFSPHKRDVT